MGKFIYTPVGVCSKKMTFEIENDVLKNIEIVGGCPGNSKGIANLIIGMNIDDIIEKLENVKCGFKNTSCPDQIAKALLEYKKKN